MLRQTTPGRRSTTWITAVLLAAATLAVWLYGSHADTAEPQWFKGQTHCHSYWSDGDHFPEVVALKYKEAGFHFLCISDHNVLKRGQRAVKLHGKKTPRLIEKSLAEYRERFGDEWVEIHGEGEAATVRLKTLDEFQGLVEEPGRFLLIESEEITTKPQGKQVHVNALNLGELIPPDIADTPVATLRHHVLAVGEQSRRLGRPILAHVNHPGWPKYDVPPEDVAGVPEIRFFELCNNGDGSNHFGDSQHPGMEQFWDIVCAIRLGQMKALPVYGVASDDTHRYHPDDPDYVGKGLGRGWITVRAAELTPEALLAAMDRGDFYATTGVELKRLHYDAKAGTLEVAVAAEPGVEYRIEFVGTPVDFAHRPGPKRRGYPASVAEVLSETVGTTAAYRLTGNELYVRAVVRSDKRLANPPVGAVEVGVAWTQPVGWEKRVKPAAAGGD